MAVSERKPRVNKLIPTLAIDRYLGRIHVGTPDEEIVEKIKTAPGLQKDARWTPALLQQAIQYALWRHHRNLAEYQQVMSGRIQRRKTA